MKNFLTTLKLIMVFLLVFYISGCNKANRIIENNSAYIELRKDLNGFNSLIDKKTGRNYASGLDSCIYIIRFGNNYKESSVITSAMASKRKAVKTEDGLELQYWHQGDIPVNVICKLSFNEDSSLKWSIKVNNESKRTLCLIEYPRISCTQVLGTEYQNDRVVFPGCEGALLSGMYKKGASRKATYPGQLGAQIMYYYDPDGGFYYAAHDGEGFKKTLSVSNSRGSMVFSHEYFLPIEYQSEVEMPYSVITDFSGGRWEDGAGIYRNWAEKQEWCKNTILERDIPEWMKKPNLYVLFSYKSKEFSSAQKANSLIKKYHDFYDIPVVATGWSWEKNGIWIGPDYFPPVHGDQYYTDLAGMAKKRGDHLHVYNSGFRWAVKKPMTEKKMRPDLQISTEWIFTWQKANP